MLLNEMLNNAMAIGVRVEPELERRLDQLAISLGKSRSTCVREAIALYVDRFSGGEEAMRQSQLIGQQAGSSHWSEQVPDWSDWTA
jgi:predicted transcriptional regulator